MRLIGGNDYYDGVQGMGHDTSIVFVRPKDKRMDADEAEALGLWTVRHPFSLRLLDASSGRRSRSGFLHHEASIGVSDATHTVAGVAAYVCGKRYAGVCVESQSVPFSGRSGRVAAPERTNRFLWDWGTFASHMASAGIRAEPNHRKWTGRFADRRAQSYFMRQEVPPGTMDLLVSRRITIATCLHETSPASWRIDGDDLGSIGFFKVMDTFTMFQEIEMWVSGVLAGSGNPMARITDDRVRIHKAGFDPVTSFRRSKAA